MQNWKFKISGQLLVPGMENTVLNIYPENFKTFNRISDYINKNEPMILVHLTLDKNLFDIMVQNAKVETLYLKVEKFNQEDDMEIPATEIYLEDEFSIILSNDINYNKELDYMDVKDNSLTPDDVKKDVGIRRRHQYPGHQPPDLPVHHLCRVKHQKLQDRQGRKHFHIVQHIADRIAENQPFAQVRDRITPEFSFQFIQIIHRLLL